MRLTKIHRISKFKQSDWIKKYIDFNTEKRKNADKQFCVWQNNGKYAKKDQCKTDK